MYRPVLFFLVSLELIFCYKLETGRDSEVAKYSQQGERGENSYVGQHQTEQGSHGHHDKANLRKEYLENLGQKNGYNHNDGYYSNHHQGEKGSRGYHFEDNGKYAKGHRTKGHHNIHKLNEYKKNIDFYDENNDEGFEEQHGGYETKKEIAQGNKHKGKFSKKGFLQGAFGIEDFSDKGKRFFNNHNHKESQGQDGYYANNENINKKGGETNFKNWRFTNFNKE